MRGRASTSSSSTFTSPEPLWTDGKPISGYHDKIHLISADIYPV